MITYTDVTGMVIRFSEDQLIALIQTMPQEKRCFARILAKTIQHPHEIWQMWERDTKFPDNWVKVRTYLSLLDIDGTPDQQLTVPLVRFCYRDDWELHALDVEIGRRDDLVARLNPSIRSGDIIWTSTRQ